MQAVTPHRGSLPSIILSPLHTGIPIAGGTMEVLVRVQAPIKSEENTQSLHKARSPLRLALVVDRSGSMNGQPLAEALRCVNHIVGRLQGTDQVSVVLYDDLVQVPIALRGASNPEAVRAALSDVESGGSTDLCGGWEAGAKQLEGGTKDTISRIILLSDGQANAGVVEPEQIEAYCARWLAAGVSTTTVGLGRGFNEELMIGMARAGGGQQYYGQTAEDLFDGFDEELALLESMCMRKLRIKLIAGPGVIVEPLGLVRQNAHQSISLTDLAWGAESWVLVRLHVTSSTPDGPNQTTLMGKRALLTASLEAENMDGAAVSVRSAVLALDCFAETAWRALPADQMVAQRLQEVQFGETGDQVRGLIAQGDIPAARTLLASMKSAAAEHPWLLDKVARLSELIERDSAMASKELYYNRAKMSYRLAARENIQYSLDETNSDMPAFFRRKSAEGAGREAGKP